MKKNMVSLKDWPSCRFDLKCKERNKYPLNCNSECKHKVSKHFNIETRKMEGLYDEVSNKSQIRSQAVSQMWFANRKNEA